MESRQLTAVIASLAVSMGLILSPAAHAAVQLAGSALEVYGEVDLSLDLSDTDKPGDSRNFSLSSNETHLGFKGRHDLNQDDAIIWQLEQEISLDQGNGEFATLNSYAGFSGRRVGTILAGYYETPFRAVGARWNVLDNTVGEHRAILGAGATSGDVMNLRARNALVYIKNFQSLEVQVMYATDAQDTTGDNVDDNHNDLFSAALWYNLGLLSLSAGYENSSHLVVDGTVYNSVRGLRIAATHRVTRNGQIGLIFESINTDNLPDLDRDVFGINGKYTAGPYTYAGQLLMADSYDGTSNSGAIKIGLGITRQVDPQTQVYAAFGMTDNENNASYNAVAGDHGDKVDTVLGGTPDALSAGFTFSF